MRIMEPAIPLGGSLSPLTVRDVDDGRYRTQELPAGVPLGRVGEPQDLGVTWWLRNLDLERTYLSAPYFSAQISRGIAPLPRPTMG